MVNGGSFRQGGRRNIISKKEYSPGRLAQGMRAGNGDRSPSIVSAKEDVLASALVSHLWLQWCSTTHCS
jgi:hypothetical protein